jgi:shikimate dehydrogenase
MTISGRTKLIAHLGYPTEGSSNSFFKLSNIHGGLVTMPHKVTTVALLDEVRFRTTTPDELRAVAQINY